MGKDSQLITQGRGHFVLGAVQRTRALVGRRTFVLFLVTAAFVAALPTSAAFAVRYGVNVTAPEDMAEAGSARAKTGGITRVRVALDWGRIDTSSDLSQWNWGQIDTLMTHLARNGIEMLPVISGVPDRKSYDRCVGQEAALCNKFPGGDGGQSQFGAFAKEVARRYGRINSSDSTSGAFWRANPSVPYRPVESYQIWNEVNRVRNSPVDSPVASSMANEYADLIKQATPAIRSVDSSALIVTAGMQPTDGGSAPGVTFDAFMDNFYNVSLIKQFFDTVGIHSYPNTDPTRSWASQEDEVIADFVAIFEGQERTLRENGDQYRRIWMTEMGIGSPPGDGRRATDTLDEHAQFLKRTFTKLNTKGPALNIDQAFWYSWFDACQSGGSSDPNWALYAGLFYADCSHSGVLSPKPAWTQFVTFTGGQAQ